VRGDRPNHVSHRRPYKLDAVSQLTIGELSGLGGSGAGGLPSSDLTHQYHSPRFPQNGHSIIFARKKWVVGNQLGFQDNPRSSGVIVYHPRSTAPPPFKHYRERRRLTSRPRRGVPEIHRGGPVGMGYSFGLSKRRPVRVRANVVPGKRAPVEFPSRVRYQVVPLLPRIPRPKIGDGPAIWLLKWPGG